MKLFLLALGLLIGRAALAEFPSSNEHGVVKAYDKAPEDVIFQMFCQFYSPQMELILRFPYLMCKNVRMQERRFFFFRRDVSRWLVMDGGWIGLLDSAGALIWKVEGNFSHDITWDEKKREIIAIEDKLHSVADTQYMFAHINRYSPTGELIRSWSSFEHLEELSKFGSWRDFNGQFKVPVSSRMKKHDVVLGANFVQVLDHDWRASDDLLIPKGTLLVYFRALGVLFFFDHEMKIIWSFDFNTNPKPERHFDIHTPILKYPKEIIAFLNVLNVDDGGHSGVVSFSTGPSMARKMIYKVPTYYEGQAIENGSFGSVQILSDDSLLISTGSSYGGIVHIDKDGHELFSWLNPVKSTTASGVEFPKPIYRIYQRPQSIWKSVSDLLSL